jgi:hypothetical protein
MRFKQPKYGWWSFVFTWVCGPLVAMEAIAVLLCLGYIVYASLK